MDTREAWYIGRGEMIFFFETALFGLALGATYALMAAGLTLVFGVTRAINFAHGEFYMIGGYAFVMAASVIAGLPPVIALLAAPAVGFGLAWSIHRILLKPQPVLSRFNDSDHVLIVTFALSILLQNGAVAVFGAGYRRPPSLLPEAAAQALGLPISADRLAAILGAVVAMGLLWVVLRYSSIGRRWRAVSQDRIGAEVSGLDVASVGRSAFAVGGALAAVSGGLLAPLLSVFPTAGVGPLTVSFVVIVLGGMGSVPGAVLGGLIVGLVDTFGAAYISSSYSQAYGFVLLLLILMLRPQGLFGRSGRSF